MSTQGFTATNQVHQVSTSRKTDQYTLWQILAIWFAAGPLCL